MEVISENKIVTLSYEVRDGGPGGPLVEQMSVHYPFKFMFGTGNLLPGFEKRLAGLSESDTFNFVLPPDQAYGFREEGNILALDKSIFDQSPDYRDQPLQIDTFVSLTDDQGDTHNGKIVTFKDDKVTVDFNHAMAGKTLHFSGVVLNIRPASVDELVRKSYIESGGVRR